VRLSGLTVLALVAACKATNPSDADPMVDAGGDGLPAPQVDAPNVTPLDTVAIRGHAIQGTRVVGRRSDGLNRYAPIIPGGSFCLEMPITDGANESYEIVSITEDGLISEPVNLDVRQDSGAPEPDDAFCDDVGGTGEQEICGNGIDDDFKNGADDCDVACNRCVDDAREPNDGPFDVPQAAKGTATLQLCPCNNDWFAFSVATSGRVKVSVTFPTALDLDLALYKADDAENGGSSVATSNGTGTTTEAINYAVPEAGTYYLKVFTFSLAKPQGTYTLRVE
jgi:hypothetical protein